MNKNTSILFASIAIAMLGYGMAMPILPFFIEELGGGGLQLGMLVASYGLMQLIFAPVWGTLSDRHGRKKILMVGMVGLSLAMALFGLSTRLWMLYAAQILSGILACAMFPVSMAYIGDSTSSEDRGGAIGKVGAAAGLGIILGPGIGGLLATRSLSTPFFLGSLICLATVLIILVFLPESLPPEKRVQGSRTVRSFSFRRIGQSLMSPIGFGLFIAFAVYFGKSNFSSIYGLYALERFGYGPGEVGSILMIMSLVYLIAQGILVGPLTRRFGERRVILGALLGNALGFVLMLLARSFLTMVLAICLFILVNALLKPSALSLISKQSSLEQGVTMGLAESWMSIGRIIGPLWAGLIFDVHLSLPFISGALFFLVVFLRFATPGFRSQSAAGQQTNES